MGAGAHRRQLLSSGEVVVGCCCGGWSCMGNRRPTGRRLAPERFSQSRGQRGRCRVQTSDEEVLLATNEVEEATAVFYCLARKRKGSTLGSGWRSSWCRGEDRKWSSGKNGEVTSGHLLSK